MLVFLIQKVADFGQVHDCLNYFGVLRLFSIFSYFFESFINVDLDPLPSARGRDGGFI